ncbi:MAG: UDP-3-O-(3-hydroxymyristoyl)glucosamine N-acyltransferase [Planctomycetes bacterium]|nr:UDP-3-O-(3-hydroxymyristoyl)glucosamine N-acyltransferase [Planctomycetota bacterium]
MPVTSMRLSEIADFLEGEVVGDPAIEITAILPVEAAAAGAIAFISNRKYVRSLATTKASAVLVSPELAELPHPETTSLVVLDDPYMGFAKLLNHWTYVPREVTGISPLASVDPSAKLGADVNVMPFVYIGPDAVIGDRVDLHPGSYVGKGSVIGEDTILGPNAVVHHDCEVGERCHLYAGAVIGSDGFGFAPDRVTGLHLKIPQIGRTVIESDVEIGANSTVDRASMGETRVGRGTKIDNLVQLGHAVQVGMGCFLVSQSGVSGSSKVGHGVMIAGQAGIAGHVNIGDGATIGAKAGVHADVPSGSSVLGSPAFEGERAKRSLAAIRKLPEFRRRLRNAERRLEALESTLSSS